MAKKTKTVYLKASERTKEKFEIRGRKGGRTMTQQILRDALFGAYVEEIMGIHVSDFNAEWHEVSTAELFRNSQKQKRLL